jgi:hypothetical protein
LYGVNIAAIASAASTTTPNGATTAVVTQNANTATFTGTSQGTTSDVTPASALTGSASSSNIGAIVGGAVGGFVVLCILIAALVYIWRKNPKEQKPKKREEDIPRTPFFPEDDNLVKRHDLEKGREQVSTEEILKDGYEPETRERAVNEYDGPDVPSGRLRYLDHPDIDVAQ